MSKFILFSDPLYQDSTFLRTTLNAEAKTNLPSYILDVIVENQHPGVQKEESTIHQQGRI